MSEKNPGILEAIDMALEAEKKANEFYLDAYEKVTNEKGKDLLKQLSDFELNHYNKLNELKSSLKENSEFIEYEGTEFKPFMTKGRSEISAKIEPDKEDVLHILSLAIDAETKAHEHYVKMAEDTTDPKGKDMFQKLADEETQHRRILSDEFYMLSNKGGIWFWGD